MNKNKIEVPTKGLPEIVLNGETCNGRIIGTLDGFNVIVEDAPHFKPDTHVNIESPDSKTKISGEDVRIDESGRGRRIGFRIDGDFKGSLKDLRPADILTGLYGSKRTGTLEVKSDSAVKKIFIKDGDIISAWSDNKEDDLGELLFREGKITLDEYNSTVKKSEGAGQGVGKLLVDSESLTQEELSLAEQHQIEEIILSFFSLEGGMFEFQEAPVPADELIIVQKNFSDLIYCGMKRTNDFLYIEQICPPLESVMNFNQDSLNILQTFDIDDSDKNLLFHINSMFSIKTLLSHSLSNDFETLKAICAFLKIGIIKEKSDDEVPVTIAFEDIFGKSDEAAPTEFLEKIEEMYSKCERLGYYEVLGLEENDDIEEVKKAYYGIAEEFRPEKQYAFPSEEIEAKLIKILSYNTRAYEYLVEKFKAGKEAEGAEDIGEPPSIGDAYAGAGHKSTDEEASEEPPAPDAEEQKAGDEEAVEEEKAEAGDKNAEEASEEPPAPDPEEQIAEELQTDTAESDRDNAPVPENIRTKKIWSYAAVISVAVVISAVILIMLLKDSHKETGPSVQAVEKTEIDVLEDEAGSVRVIPVASMQIVPLPPFRNKLFSELLDGTDEKQ